MKIELRDRVALMSLNAGKANAIGMEFLTRLNTLLDELERSDARAVVMTGYESFFSAGLDLPSLVSLSRTELTAFIERFDETMLRIFELPRPVIAAVNGHAVAGGCVLALQADERFMADGSGKIGLNEVMLGIGLPAGVLESLRCQVPPSTLVPVALEGKLVSPSEAKSLGLVSDVLPQGELLERCVSRGQALAQLPPVAYAHVKAQIRSPVARVIREAWTRADSKRWVDTWFSPDGQDRIKSAVARLAKKK